MEKKTVIGVCLILLGTLLLIMAGAVLLRG